MTYVAGFVVLAGFALALRWLAVVAVAGAAITTARGATRVLRDAVQSDLEKERAARAASLALARCFGSIAARAAVAAAAALGLLVAFDRTGLAPLAAVNDVLTSWNGALLAVPAMPLMLGRKPRP